MGVQRRLGFFSKCNQMLFKQMMQTHELMILFNSILINTAHVVRTFRTISARLAKAVSNFYPQIFYSVNT